MADLEQIWTAPTSGTASAPVTSKHAVHVASDNVVYGLDQRTGAELWTWEEPNLPDWATTGPPIYADDGLWVSFGLPNLGGNYVTRRLDPLTGEVLDAPGSSGIVDGVRGGRYLQSRVGLVSDIDVPVWLDVSVRDLDDPSIGWSGIVDWQPISGGVGWSPLTLGTDQVYQAGHGLLTADPVTQGNGVRGYSIEERPECPPDTPAQIVCPSWATPLDGGSAGSPVLAADGSMLYTGTSAGTVYAVDTSDGAIEWSAAVGTGNAQPSLADGNLYVATRDRLVVLDATTGAELWEADAVLGQPAVAGGVVFSNAGDGLLRAFDAAGCGAATCDPLWEADTGASITGNPAVSNGRVFVGTTAGLVAYALPR